MDNKWLTAQPLMIRARAWEDRNPREGGFRRSIVHHEACIYRKIVARSQLTKAEKLRLTKMVNLWFKHRLDGLIRCGNEMLAEKMGVVRNTFRTFIRWAIGKGFVTAVGGGSGRGDRTAYAVNLGAIQQALAPNMTVTAGDERVTIEGEIDVAQKGSISPCPSIDNTRGVGSKPSFPFRWLRASERFWMGAARQTEMLTAVIRRLRDNREGKPVAGHKHCPAKPILACMGEPT